MKRFGSLVIAIIFGLGIVLSTSCVYGTPNMDSKVTVQENPMEEAVEYKVFVIELANPMTGLPVTCEYKLPMEVPTPTPQTHDFDGRILSEGLGIIQFYAKDKSHIIIIFVDIPTLVGIGLGYYLVKEDILTEYVYDENGDPQYSSSKHINEILKERVEQGNAESKMEI